MPAHVFVIGLDDFNRQLLESIENGDAFQFRELLSLEEIRRKDAIVVKENIDKAERILRGFTGRVDAVIGWWDFPVSLMVPLLCERLGLVSAPLRSAVACEHKYWSRLEQQKVVPDMVPRFQALDPFGDDPVAALEIDFPFWIKPVKAYASQLGYRVEDRGQFQEAIAAIRKGIERFAEPFDSILDQVSLPQEVAPVRGSWCIVEGITSGRQCTIEGFVKNREITVYGVVDSFRFPNQSTFSRYQYPSRLPDRIKERMTGAAQHVLEAVGYDNAPFNIEFFWDEEPDQLWMLEINPRISQSHSDLFQKVMGVSHHQVLVQLSCGQEVVPLGQEGRYRVASKFHLRVFEDGTVTRVPDQKDIERVQDKFPGTLVQVKVEQGALLSELTGQESYSYLLAFVHMGAASEEDLLENYRQCVAMLGFERDGQRVEAPEQERSP
ncbi:MAG: ATP-grasp domain-containing protein [Desulfohalobiaceae bacterium]